MPISSRIKRLGSPRLAQQEYRKWLMSCPKQRWDEPEPNGRPRGETTRAAASVALHFYNAWLKEPDFGFSAGS
jgi:hypothetical protein